MLLRLKVKNFLSFYKETTFDMFPNPRKTTFENHIYNEMQIPVLKQAVIYGANGSGKSNLFDVIKILRFFATDKDFLREEGPNFIQLNKFQLLNGKNMAPVEMSIEFFQDDTYFIYEVAFDKNEIEKEALFISGIGKEENKLIFLRKKDKLELKGRLNQDVKDAIDKLIQTNPLSSILSLNNEFPILKNKKAKSAYLWFSLHVQTLSIHRRMPSLINLMVDNPKLLEFTNDIFSKIGLGIKGIDIKSEPLSEFLTNSHYANTDEIERALQNKPKESAWITHMSNDKTLFMIDTKDGEEPVVKRFIFNQIGINKIIGSLEYAAQSDGTARLLNLIPALYNIINNNYIYFIDEIECGIHPSLIFALISFFAKEKAKGQLIYTTHATILLNQKELMRPDEVWFTEKKEGNTHLYSLNDFKEHNTINIQNGYLEGRYGAIPFIGNLGE